MKAVKKVAATIMGISAGILMSGAAVSTDVIIDYGYGSCDTREKIFVVAVAIFLLTLYAAAVSDSFHFNNCKRIPPIRPKALPAQRRRLRSIF